jgi:2-oxoisovalerate dehydrogenase E1 component alpha subunit
VCENNGYAISERADRQMANVNVADKAAGYGVHGECIDGNDVLQVRQTMVEAVERARAGGGPTLIDAKTYRLMPHTSDDDDRQYRSQEEVQGWRERDPVERFGQWLLSRGVLTPADIELVRAQAGAATEDATQFAEQAAPPAPHTLADHVYAER